MNKPQFSHTDSVSTNHIPNAYQRSVYYSKTNEQTSSSSDSDSSSSDDEDQFKIASSTFSVA